MLKLQKTLMLQIFSLVFFMAGSSWSSELLDNQKAACYQTLANIQSSPAIPLKSFEKIKNYQEVHEKGLPDAIYEMLKEYRQKHEVEFYSHPMDINFLKFEGPSRILGYKVVIQHDELHSMTFTFASSKPGAGFLYHVETKTPGPIYSNEFPCDDSREQNLNIRF